MSRSHLSSLVHSPPPQVVGLAFLLVLCTCLALSLPAHAAPAAEVRATQVVATVPAGELVFAGGEAVAERFVLPRAVHGALAKAGRADRLALDDFPIAPGFRAALELERFDPYAPGAAVWTVDAAGRHPTPRSGRLFYAGRGRDDEALRVAFSYDPASGAMQGLSRGPVGFYELQDTAGGYRVVAPETLLPEGVELDYGGCASEALAVPETIAAAMADTAPLLVKAVTPALQAVVAVDTDSSFMQKKFSDNGSAATAWIEDLFVAMNVMYERDLSLRLLIGETTLRVGSDPYPTNSSGASSAHLQEFGSYWAANRGGVTRTFAMLLSGNSSSGFSSSGIAWLDGYCEKQSTGGGYSVTQVFTGAGIPVSSDLRVIAHELGHNLGSPHTHCYTPTPIDTCFNLQTGLGCYQGSTTSCPAGGQGTLMSYCHVGACGTQNLAELHPRTIGLIDGLLVAHTPTCVQPLQATTSALIFSDGFELGSLLRWAS